MVDRARTRFPWIWISAAGLVLLLALLAGPAVDQQAPLSPGAERAVADAEAPGLAGRGPAQAAPGAGVPLPVAPGDDARAQGDAAGRPAPLDTMRRGLRLTAAHPDVLPVIAIQERHTADLMKHPLVVGTAVGLDARGNIAVVILTKSPAPDLPRFLDGVPVVEHVSGEIFATKGGPPAGKGGDKEPSVDPTARFARPVPIGVSTGHVDITAGTIGCRVVGKTDGKVYALSNNHVYANENLATDGDNVLQPGPYDGGIDPDDAIGTLADFEPIKFGGVNYYDAAIAETTTSKVGNATPSDGYGLPKSTPIVAALNDRVMKYGRTTAETKGRVYALNANVNVGYDGGVALFVGQLVITPGSVSAPGDSGSLFVLQRGGDARSPIALLFAGSTTATIASPIGPILTRFDVTVDGE